MKIKNVQNFTVVLYSSLPNEMEFSYFESGLENFKFEPGLVYYVRLEYYDTGTEYTYFSLKGLESKDSIIRVLYHKITTEIMDRYPSMRYQNVGFGLPLLPVTFDIKIYNKRKIKSKLIYKKKLIYK